MKKTFVKERKELLDRSLSMVYFAFVYRWFVCNDTYYPQGGMQAIPDNAVKVFKQHGGTVMFNMEVSEIIMEEGQAGGVKTKNGEEYISEPDI